MNINKIYTNIAFKGYDAAPLKALHTGQNRSFVKELEKVAEEEGFELKTSKYSGGYSQDMMTVLENKGNISLLMKDNVSFFTPLLPEIEKEYGMKIDLRELFASSSLSGGNYFIGKKPDGQKWMIIGDADRWNCELDEISKTYDIDKKNIHFIPQQDYHLDMSIRPIGYPYVLVNSPIKSLKNIDKIKGKKPDKNISIPDNKKIQYKKEVEMLQEAGFIPITIGGVYENGINFLNAVVNMHPDGSISYITNSSKSTNPLQTKYQRKFEKDLRNSLNELSKTDSNAPKLKNVYFIEGELYNHGNEMTSNILEGDGGIHCMTFEEPNFEVWG